MEKRRHTEVIKSVLPLAGRRVLDIGCGQGTLAAWLGRQGTALVAGVDAQAEAAAAARAKGASAVVAVAEALPFAARCFDAALIFNSLHHFPDPAAALGEAARVLAVDGTLFVVEPLAEGGYFSFMQPVDDETAVRRAALAALDRAAALGFDRGQAFDYAYDVKVRDLDGEIAGWLAVDPRRAARIDAVRDELARRFRRHGIATDDGYAFAQPMRAFVLHRRA